MMTSFSVGPSDGRGGTGGQAGGAIGANPAEALSENWRHAMRSLKRFVASPAPDGDGLATPLASDVEAQQQQQEPQWTAWAKTAVERVREQAAQAAEQAHQNLQQGLERAQTVDWTEQVQGVRGSVTRHLETVTTTVSSTTSAVTANLQDRVSNTVESARSLDLAEQARGLQRGVTRSFEAVAAGATTATSTLQENAAVAAGASRRALSVAGERVTGAASLAMDPQRLMRFAGVFLLGTLLIMISMNFLPALILKPANFAFFFTLGSVTMMGSFVLLSGPKAFIAGLTHRSKLPFSAAYVTGLVGTLVATLILRSYVFTAVFALLQALALLYLVASYLPGGTQFLNLLGRVGGRSARSFALG